MCLVAGDFLKKFIFKNLIILDRIGSVNFHIFLELLLSLASKPQDKQERCISTHV